MGNIESNEYWGNQLPLLVNHGIGGRLNLRSVLANYLTSVHISWGHYKLNH